MKVIEAEGQTHTGRSRIAVAEFARIWMRTVVL